MNSNNKNELCPGFEVEFFTKSLLPFALLLYKLYTVPSGSSAHTKKKICKTCSLILVADYEFFRDVGRGSVSKAKKKRTLRVHQSQSCLVDIFIQFAKEVFISNKGIQSVFQKFHCRLLL